MICVRVNPSNFIIFDDGHNGMSGMTPHAMKLLKRFIFFKVGFS